MEDCAGMQWESGLLDDDIVMRVRDGVVTLGGFVDCSGDRSKAERIATVEGEVP